MAGQVAAYMDDRRLQAAELPKDMLGTGQEMDRWANELDGSWYLPMDRIVRKGKKRAGLTRSGAHLELRS